jgi:hypothetical protein
LGIEIVGGLSSLDLNLGSGSRTSEPKFVNDYSAGPGNRRRKTLATEAGLLRCGFSHTQPYFWPAVVKGSPECSNEHTTDRTADDAEVTDKDKTGGKQRELKLLGANRQVRMPNTENRTPNQRRTAILDSRFAVGRSAFLAAIPDR